MRREYQRGLLEGNIRGLLTPYGLGVLNTFLFFDVCQRLYKSMVLHPIAFLPNPITQLFKLQVANIPITLLLVSQQYNTHLTMEDLATEQKHRYSVISGVASPTI